MKHLIIALALVALIFGAAFALLHHGTTRWESEAAADAADAAEYHRLAGAEKIAHAKTQAWIEWKIKKCQAKNPKLSWLKADGVGDPVCAEAPATPQVPEK
jgi:hypothetical protein